MSNVSEFPYAQSLEVQHMCVVKKGCDHGPAPLPEEGKWIQAKQISDISAYTHGVGWCAPQQGACKLSLNVKNGIIEEALVETIGCSGMTHSAAMAAEILPGKTILEALNTDLVCDAINTAMRELFLQIVYGRSQSAFSEGGLVIGAGMEDLGKGNYTDGSYKKINGAPNALTNEGFASALSDALGVDIDFYFEIKLSTVKKIVDTISGVDVNVPMDMDYEDPTQGLSIHLKKGNNHLSGEEAISFIRFRSGYITGDIGRLDAQKIFLNAFVKRIGEQKNPITLLNIFKLVLSEGITNINEQDLISLGMKCSKNKGGKTSYLTAAGEAVQSEDYDPCTCQTNHGGGC